MATTSYSRPVMCHLMCVSYVVLSAHFSNSSQVTVPENKEALILILVVLVHSDGEVIPQNSQLTTLQKGLLFRASMHLFLVYSKKKDQCSWLKTVEI